MADEDVQEPEGQEPEGDDQQQEEPRQDESGKDLADEVKKWKALARKHEGNSKVNAEAARKLKELEDAQKSEQERQSDALEQYKTRADKAEAQLRKRTIAEDRAPEHASLAQIKAVAKRLSGDSDEDLEADADELFELLAPEPSAPKVPSRPKESLRGGGDPDEPPEETDPRKLADMIRRR
ncbi:hypothetical protein [Saccharopolyspora sp. 6V]|uniref:hypothetical protein n=1 Tax=Saccharopolyspora sp. 6V TaxID=2877239 RepID=UPI001CD812D8|nr:hypothetical protein [Saccharopolyspora sp. 6V]MCA1191622.1 hypothetical protein [Saccharopolyspora sp. 6V]